MSEHYKTESLTSLTKSIIAIFITISAAWLIWVSATTASNTEEINKLKDKNTENNTQMRELKEEFKKQTIILYRIQLDNELILIALSTAGDKNIQNIIKNRKNLYYKEDTR